MRRKEFALQFLDQVLSSTEQPVPQTKYKAAVVSARWFPRDYETAIFVVPHFYGFLILSLAFAYGVSAGIGIGDRSASSDLR